MKKSKAQLKRYILNFEDDEKKIQEAKQQRDKALQRLKEITRPHVAK